MSLPCSRVRGLRVGLSIALARADLSTLTRSCEMPLQRGSGGGGRGGSLVRRGAGREFRISGTASWSGTVGTDEGGSRMTGGMRSWFSWLEEGSGSLGGGSGGGRLGEACTRRVDEAGNWGLGEADFVVVVGPATVLVREEVFEDFAELEVELCRKEEGG